MCLLLGTKAYYRKPENPLRRKPAIYDHTGIVDSACRSIQDEEDLPSGEAYRAYSPVACHGLYRIRAFFLSPSQAPSEARGIVRYFCTSAVVNTTFTTFFSSLILHQVRSQSRPGGVLLLQAASRKLEIPPRSEKNVTAGRALRRS